MVRIKITSIGGTVLVRIPLDWKREKNLKKGDFVNVTEDQDGNLVISAGAN